MPDAENAPQPWRLPLTLATLALAIVAIGLPINDLWNYVLLLIVTVAAFTGRVSADRRNWLAAIGIVAVAIVGQLWLAPPRIDEGHNVFLPGGPGILQRDLPADVYRQLLATFDEQYPPAVRCGTGTPGCWQNGGFPDRAFAFSADGIFHRSRNPSDMMSRAVTSLDFSDPVWLGLGFVNEKQYNWYTTAPDVHRADQDRRFWMGLHRWHLAMPWFEMIRIPAAYVGGQLCWRGDIMWEGSGEHFSLWRGESCRPIEPADAGRRVVGIGIKPDSLAMRLTPPWSVWFLQAAATLLKFAAVFGVMAALLRFDPRRLALPALLIGLSLLVIAVADASFIAGLRPMEGGDDGLFYDGTGRLILQKFLAGDIYGALEGGEAVFYYGGPGLRYFRALEHVIFGETYLGYLSLVLLLPLLVLMLFRRFVSERWAVVLVIMFIAVPLGELFGTTFIDYAKWAFRGYADPAAYILFLAGLIPLLGSRAHGPTKNFMPAFFGALVLALAIAMKPIVAPAAAVFLGGAGLAALYYRQWPRLTGMCIGFLPVFSMALHNWVYGHALVLFSANANHPLVLVMPPSAYVAAFHELITLNFSGGNLLRALKHIPDWLSGPAESYWTVPLNAAGVVILVYVVAFGRRFDPWLRLVGGAAIAQHIVALFYVATARYHFLTWFLTLLVVLVFVQEIGLDWLRRRYPTMSERLVLHPLSRKFANGVSWLQKVSA